MKKKIIFVVIGILLIFLTGYTYSVVNGKESCGSESVITAGSFLPGVVIGNEDKCRLANIKIESLCGERVYDSDGNCTLPATFEELKNCSGFKTIDATGILTVEVLDYNYNVVESYTVNGNEKSSQWVKLSAGTQYTLQVTSEGFNGKCDAEVDIYNLY